MFYLVFCFLLLNLTNYAVSQTCSDTWSNFVVEKDNKKFLEIDSTTAKVTIQDASLFIKYPICLLLNLLWCFLYFYAQKLLTTRNQDVGAILTSVQNQITMLQQQTAMIQTLQNQVSTLTTQLNAAMSDLSDAKTKLAAMVSPSITLPHWGLQSCPSPSKLVYEGIFVFLFDLKFCLV